MNNILQAVGSIEKAQGLHCSWKLFHTRLSKCHGRHGQHLCKICHSWGKIYWFECENLKNLSGFQCNVTLSRIIQGKIT